MTPEQLAENPPSSAPLPKPKRRKSPLPKLIEKLYTDLKDLAHQNVLYEMGTSRKYADNSAFLASVVQAIPSAA